MGETVENPVSFRTLENFLFPVCLYFQIFLVIESGDIMLFLIPIFRKIPFSFSRVWMKGMAVFGFPYSEMAPALIIRSKESLWKENGFLFRRWVNLFGVLKSPRIVWMWGKRSWYILSISSEQSRP